MALPVRLTAVATAVALGAATPVPHAHAGSIASFVAETRLNGNLLPRSTFSGTATVSADGKRFAVRFEGVNVSPTETTVTAGWRSSVFLTGAWCVGRSDAAYYNHRLVAPPSSFQLSLRSRRHTTRKWSQWYTLRDERFREATPDIEVVSGWREACVLHNDSAYRGGLDVEMRYVAKLRGSHRITSDVVVLLG